MSTDVFGHDPALWAGWIPAGVLGGGGIGLIVTSLGAAAARALPPQQFATGVGMNVTARQTGGALGVAVLAAVLASDAGDSLTAFHTAFAVSAGIAAVAAVTSAIPHRAKELR